MDYLNGIIWDNDRPTLYVTFESYTSAHVINGGWGLYDLDMDKKQFMIDHPFQKNVSSKFDKITYAPKGEDYNDVLFKAREMKDELVEIDFAMHDLTPKETTFDEEDEIPF